MRKILTGIFVLAISTYTCSAQLSGVTTTSADTLVNYLLGNNNNIVVSNATLNCSNDNAAGTFTAVSTNLGMTSGIILTTGSVFDATGINLIGNSTVDSQAPGDPALDTLTDFISNDACVLEFDMFIPGDSVKFNYVFASEEYNDFSCSIFNDVFGFFISGPNPLGGNYNGNNIALIPNTTLPVTINNINCCTPYSNYFICNEPFGETSTGDNCDAGFCACTVGCPGSSAETTVGYDGFTTVLTAKAHVVACNVYHLKIAIADGGNDWSWDSGVFLEAGSLQSNALDITIASLYTDPNGNPAAVENCDVNANIDIHLDTYVQIGDSVFNTGAQDTICFSVTLAGNAVESVDYLELPETVCFYPGDTLLSVSVVPITDALVEGFDTLIIQLIPSDTTLSGCDALGATTTIFIYDDPVVVATATPSHICAGDTVVLSSGFAPNPVWSPVTGIIGCINCGLTEAVPPNTMIYTITASVSVCTAADTVLVIVDEPAPIVATTDQTICLGDSTTLTASNSTAYEWSPATDLNSTTGASIQASPTTTTTYNVHGYNSCFESDDQVIVFVNDLPSMNADNNSSICPEDQITLGVDAPSAETYEWSPTESLNDPNVENPIADPNSTTTYYVYITDANGCINYDSLIVDVYIPEPINADVDNNTVHINELEINKAHITTQSGSNFVWTPTLGLNLTNPSAPVANPTVTTTYVVTAQDVHGCFVSDTIIITVLNDVSLLVPNAFSPNGDDLNSTFRFKALGVFALDRFVIYDRWGIEIFVTNKMTSDGFSEGWNGKVSGDEAEIGSYAYLITGQDIYGKPVVHQGNVTLIR